MHIIGRIHAVDERAAAVEVAVASNAKLARKGGQDVEALRGMIAVERSQRESADDALRTALDQLRTEMADQKQSTTASSTSAAGDCPAAAVAVAVWNASLVVLLQRAERRQ